MKASTAVLMIVLIGLLILSGWFWFTQMQSKSDNKTPLSEPKKEKIELEKIFENTVVCEECGLTTLD